MENKKEFLEASVYNYIKNNASKKNPVTSKTLCNELNVSFRELKRLITSLRKEYPIVAKETEGGGYWIAENEDDIINFIQMIQRRKQGYEETITTMSSFIADYGSVPYID